MVHGERIARIIVPCLGNGNKGIYIYDVKLLFSEKIVRTKNKKGIETFSISMPSTPVFSYNLAIGVRILIV